MKNTLEDTPTMPAKIGYLIPTREAIMEGRHETAPLLKMAEQAEGLGYDSVWVGVMITIVIEIGQVTPPVGLNLSVVSALTNNDVSLGRVAIATIPYWLIHLFAIFLLTLFPAIALFLPDLLF